MAPTMPLTMEDIAALGRRLRVAQTRPGLSAPDHPPVDLRGGGDPVFADSPGDSHCRHS